MTLVRKQDILSSIGVILLFILANMAITASAEGGERTPAYLEGVDSVDNNLQVDRDV